MTKLIELYRKMFPSEAERFAAIEREVKARLQAQFPSCHVGDL